MTDSFEGKDQRTLLGGHGRQLSGFDPDPLSSPRLCHLVDQILAYALWFFGGRGRRLGAEESGEAQGDVLRGHGRSSPPYEGRDAYLIGLVPLVPPAERTRWIFLLFRRSSIERLLRSNPECDERGEPLG